MGIYEIPSRGSNPLKSTYILLLGSNIYYKYNYYET